MKLMVIEQSNMEAKQFTDYSQGRRQVFRTEGSKIVSFSSLPFPFLLLFLVGRRDHGAFGHIKILNMDSFGGPLASRARGLCPPSLHGCDAAAVNAVCA